MNPSDKPDQADILAQFSQLTVDHVTAKHTIGTLTADKTKLETDLSQAQVEIAKLNSEKASLVSERDNLKSQNERLTGEMADFNKKLATQLAKHGIRNASDSAGENASGKKLTLTEQVLARKGVKSLEELSAARK